MKEVHGNDVPGGKAQAHLATDSCLAADFLASL